MSNHLQIASSILTNYFFVIFFFFLTSGVVLLLTIPFPFFSWSKFFHFIKTICNLPSLTILIKSSRFLASKDYKLRDI